MTVMGNLPTFSGTGFKCGLAKRKHSIDALGYFSVKLAHGNPTRFPYVANNVLFIGYSLVNRGKEIEIGPITCTRDSVKLDDGFIGHRVLTQSRQIRCVRIFINRIVNLRVVVVIYNNKKMRIIVKIQVSKTRRDTHTHTQTNKLGRIRKVLGWKLSPVVFYR